MNFHPPTARLDVDTVFRDSSKVMFTAADSSATKGAKYIWRLEALELYSSPWDSFRIRMDSTLKPHWNPGSLFEGVFRLSLVVKDVNGLKSDTSVRLIRIWDPPPVIAHVRDTSLPANKTLRVNLSARDSSGRSLKTYWALTDTSLDSSGAFYFCPMEESSWTITWVVMDAIGRIWTDKFAIDFTDKHPALDHVRDTSLPAGKSLSIKLSATDSDGVVSKYLWRTRDTIWRDSSGTVFLAPGKDTAIKVYWAARDDVGSLSVDSFTARFVNKVPALTHVGDTALMVGRTLSVDLFASDSDGTVTRYYYDTCGRKDSSATPPHLVFAPGSEVRKTVRWWVRDDVGSIAKDSFVVNFSLDRPILTGIADTSLSVLQTISVALSARGLTPSSTIAKYLWTTGSGAWTDSSDAPLIRLSNSAGGSVQVRWIARGGTGFLSIPDTFNARFVPAPSALRASVDTGLVGWNGSTGSVRFHWKGSISGFATEIVNWALWLGKSGSLALVHSGTDTAFAAAGMDSGAAYDFRLVASNRFGDTASVAGSIRPWYMSIAKLNPSSDTAVLYSTTSLTLQARVQGAQLKSVTIGGKAPSSVSGVYSATVTNLVVGPNPIWIVATDSLGNKDSLVWTVTRRPNITLTSLTVDAGTLVPTFSAATLAYRDSVVPGVEEVVLSASAGAGTTVTFDGATDGTIALADTAHTVRVVTRAGNDSLVYLVTVPPKQIPLKVLLTDRGKLLPAFSAQILSYVDTLIYGTRSVTLQARLWDNSATVTWNGGKDSVISLVTNPTVVKIVTSKAGYAPLTYTVTLYARSVPDIPWNTSVGYGKFTDTRDGQTYKMVAIGNQTWMAENLNFAAAGSSCYNNNLDTCGKYGRLYDWASALGASGAFNNSWLYPVLPVQGICPVDWHVPADSEWNILATYVQADSRVGYGSEGKALKAAAGWAVSGVSSSNGNDLFGLRIIPGGDSCSGGCSGFQGIGSVANFWTSSEVQVSTGYKSWGKSAYYRTFSNVNTNVGALYGYPGTVGLDPYSNISPSGKLSIRCIHN